MIKLYLKGKEVPNYKDWSLFNNADNDQIILSVEYHSGKKFALSFDQCRVFPCYEVSGDLLFYKNSRCSRQIKSALAVGEKYLIVKYSNSDKPYILNLKDAHISESSDISSDDVYGYFRGIATERVSIAVGENKLIAENIDRQFDKVVAFKDSALQAYLTKDVAKREGLSSLVFPFGINESQLKAVTQAFKSQISVIEGPPGTEKTQTILNIISNIIVNGGTCAIVSNNNPAVENVYEKLEKVNLDFLVAKLGNDKNKKLFFDSIKYEKPKDYNSVSIQQIDSSLKTLTKYLKVKNEYSQIISEIDEIEIEKKYLEDWYNDSITNEFTMTMKKQSSAKAIELLTYLRSLPESSLTFLNKIKLLVSYRIIKSDFLNVSDERLLYIFRLQLNFYNSLLKEKKDEQKSLENLLKSIRYDEILENLKKDSLDFLYGYIDNQMPNKATSFTDKNYRKEFDSFTKAFPVIGSSTHSLLNSIADGALLDYVIIDEASQQDLVPGILCFACARNVIVVGDRKQLPHIPTPSKLKCPNELYDCEKYSLLDSICEIFANDIPRTLLKEHYRCHPKIIKFCNKQFYDNQLIPMTIDKGEDALTLVITALGNHMRHNANLREIESIQKTHKLAGYLSDDKGFISPYNAQIKLAHKLLSPEIKKDTIHKFQGRECSEIIFSTVLDKKVCSRAQIDFVDNASLINVAVSRAIHKFTLVTGNNVFADNNKYIAALVRYMKYYANDHDIFDSPVISAFDLLYSEYDKSLSKLQSKLRKGDSTYKSEQIIAAILRDILEQEEFTSLVAYKQIYLKQLVKIDNEVFTSRETSFINKGASCDFVIYFKTGKNPISVIEVDGGYHDLPKQQERDLLKNSILGKANIPLLRLPTTASDIELKIIQHLRNCIKDSVDEIELGDFDEE